MIDSASISHSYFEKNAAAHPQIPLYIGMLSYTYFLNYCRLFASLTLAQLRACMDWHRQRERDPQILFIKIHFVELFSHLYAKMKIYTHQLMEILLNRVFAGKFSQQKPFRRQICFAVGNYCHHNTVLI